MKPAKQCKDRFEDIVALVMGELDLHAVRELQVHIAVCDACRAAYDALVEEEKGVRSSFEALARSLGPIERAVPEEPGRPSRVRVGVSNNHFLKKVKSMIVTHKRLSAAAATVTALAACLILYVSLLSSSGSAYALEQTTQANQRITSYHFKITPADELGEVWVQLNPDGTLVRARMDVSSHSEGPKVSIVSPGRAETWFKAGNSHVITDQKYKIDIAVKELMRMRALFDPKFAIEELQTGEKAGKVQVTTKESAKEGEPVTLTVTGKADPDRRQVFEVDPKTKLVQRLIDYRRHGDKWDQVSQVDYLDYNKEIDPRVFQLELPKDVATIDYTKMDFSKIGLAKGDLTDDQVATKVAKEYLEALIAEDYQKAGQIFRGVPGDLFRKSFEQRQVRYLRIVEIGKPTIFDEPRVPFKVMGVHVKVEKEIKGKKTVVDELRLVHPWEKNSDRWVISGGG